MWLFKKQTLVLGSVFEWIEICIRYFMWSYHSLTTSAAVPLPARSAVLLNGSSLGEFLSHLVLQPGDADQKTLLIDGLLQRFDVSFHLLLHALSEAAQIAASWSEPHETIQWTIPGGRQTASNNGEFDVKCQQRPVVSPGLTSASSSSVMRVTSLLEGLRARRPLAFFEESHLRLTNVTRQLLQGWALPAGDKKH